jgi:hypothetical protein
MSKPIYLCGPMTGRPQFNIPLFDRVTAALRAQGYDIVSPGELDDAETRACALASPDGAPGSGSNNGQTWGDFLSRDIKIVVDNCEGIAMLPDWEKSRGARLEVYAALLQRHAFHEVNILVNGIVAGLLPLDRHYVASVLKGNLL